MEQRAKEMLLVRAQRRKDRADRPEPFLQQRLAQRLALRGEVKRNGAAVAAFAALDQPIGHQPVHKPYRTRMRKAENAPQLVVHFSGIGSFSGSEYIEVMASILGSMEHFTVTPLDCAGSGELLYIFWQATARIGGEMRTWPGIDRMRIVDGMAVEEHVVFDSAVLQPGG